MVNPASARCGSRWRAASSVPSGVKARSQSWTMTPSVTHAGDIRAFC
ncbi:MAG: hypothetical protein BWX70_03455 [Verrucomicrobia bacterium ADurb.Bin070]|nr:MAG: hypothetical protein BWX70_03455 [Verrucomicrobia bacterium ADurb.Bin070]